MGLIGAGFAQSLGPVLQGLGAGIAAGPTFGEGVGRGLALVPRFQEVQGREQIRALQIQQAQQKAQQQQALSEAVSQGGLFSGLSPQERAVFAASPDLAAQTLANVTASRFKPRQPTALQKNLAAAGIQPGTSAFREAVLQSTKTGTTINVGEKKLSQELAKRTAERFFDIQDAGAAAAESQATTAQMRQVLGNPDVFTGTAGQAVNAAKQAGATLFGLNFAGVADAEVASILSNQLALDSAEKLKGAISNKEIALLQSLPPGLSRSPAANQVLLDLRDLSDQRALLRQEAASRALQETGEDPVAFSRAIARADRDINRQIKAKFADIRRLAKQAKSRSPLAGIPISQMSLADLRKLNPDDLTEQQSIQASERLRKLRAQGGILAR